MKRTPIEQAIAEDTNRIARYHARKKKAGFHRVSVFVPKQDVLLLKEVARRLSADHDAQCSGDQAADAEWVSTALSEVLKQRAELKAASDAAPMKSTKSTSTRAAA